MKGKAEEIYDAKFDEIYQQELAKWDQVRPRHWFEADCLQLATNMAEDAYDEFIKKGKKR